MSTVIGTSATKQPQRHRTNTVRLVPPIRDVKHQSSFLSKSLQSQPRQSKRPRSASHKSSSEGEPDEDAQHEREAMLAALQAHGRAMFGTSHFDAGETSDQGRQRFSISPNLGNDDDEEGEECHSDDGWGAEDGFVSGEDGFVSDSEDDFNSGALGKSGYDAAVTILTIGFPVVPSQVPEVVFAPSSTTSQTIMSKADRRSFLVSRLPCETSLFDVTTRTGIRRRSWDSNTTSTTDRIAKSALGKAQRVRRTSTSA